VGVMVARGAPRLWEWGRARARGWFDRPDAG
jgi:hypothetical protein